MSQTRWTLFATAAAGGVGDFVRRRRSARQPPLAPEARNPPPLTTQSSPGQIADLQQAYGAEMAPVQASAPGAGAANG
jgi:hypothetical protein